jgi:hypothetical protein
MSRAGEGVIDCVGHRCGVWTWIDPEAIEPRFKVFPFDARAAVEPDHKYRVANHIPPSWFFIPGSENQTARWVEPLDEAAQRRRGRCGLISNTQKADDIVEVLKDYLMRVGNTL